MKHSLFPLLLCALIASATLYSCQAQNEAPNHQNEVMTTMDSSVSVNKTESEWKEELPHMACFVLREKGTERAFSGEFWDHHEDGIYVCAGCKHPLFDSSTKFESGSGWLSFFDVIDNSSIDTKEYLKYCMKRI